MSEESIQTRFFTAIILGDLDDVREIIPQHPDFLTWLSPAKYPPLHMAILNQRADIAVCLAEHGADLNQVAMGESAAKAADRKGMLKLLQEASGRRGEIRQAAIELCGEQMHEGLKTPVSISRAPLRFKRSDGLKPN